MIKLALQPSASSAVRLLVLALAFHAGPSRPAAAQSCSQLQANLAAYKQQLQAYATAYNQNGCGSSRPSNAQVCASLLQAYNYTQQQITQLQSRISGSCGGSGGGGGTGQDPCTVTRNHISQRSTASYNSWYNPVANYIRQNYSYFASGRLRGFVLYYQTPPIYCTLTPRYTPAARPYYVTWDQALRVISQFRNNGYVIDNIVTY